MIRFRCARCGGTIQALPESVGREATCPSCGAFSPVPSGVLMAGEMQPPPAPRAPGPVPIGAGPGETVGKAMAVTALILGLCGLIPGLGILLGLAGGIVGIVALAKGRPGKGLAITGVVCGFALALVVQPLMSAMLLLPALGRARELSRQSACKMNLNSLGKGMVQYENNEGMRTGGRGSWAPDFDTLIGKRLAVRGFLRCPSDQSGRDVSYVYGPPAPDPSDDTIVACCRPGVHPDGVIVLYANGRVKGPIPYADFWSLMARAENVRMAAKLAELGVTESSGSGSRRRVRGLFDD